MGGRIIRNFVGLFIWMFFGLLPCVALNGLVFISNYFGCLTSFELQNYEQRPVAADPLIGWILGVFLSNATIVHIFALFVAATMSFGFYISFNLAFKIIRLCQDWRTYIDMGDRESAKIASQLILRDAVMFAIPLAVCIALMTCWDINLFKYRSIAGAMGIEDPTLASATIKDLKLLPGDIGHLFTWFLTKIGARGYIAGTVIACLGLEYSITRIGEYWTRLYNSFAASDMTEPNNQEQLFYGYDVNGQPVYDPNIPISYDTDGNPVDATQSEGALFNPAPENNIHEQASEHDVATASDTGADLREVIGSDGERISLAAAIADPQRYWVDPETHEIWDSNFRNSLMGTEQQ